MKRLDSTVKEWPGYVMLHDPIPLVTVGKFRIATRDMEWGKLIEPDTQAQLLPAIVPCVAEWHIEGFPENVTPETFPGTPSIETSKLVVDIVREIVRIMRGEKEESPNG